MANKKKKSTASRVVSIILSTLLVSMILYIGGTLYLRTTTGNPHASLFGITTHIVSTGSMEPNINVKDIIVVKRCDDYNVGDVITYIRDDGLSITHRIISLAVDGYIVQGDANPYPDSGVVKQEQIVGKTIILVKVLNGGGISFVKEADTDTWN